MEFDTDPSKIRSGLIYLSLIIILWNIAGGSMEANTGIFGGGVKFEHPEWLEYTGIAAFFYLLHRYSLLLKKRFHIFQTALMLELATDKKFGSFASSVVVSFANNQQDNASRRNSLDWSAVLDSFYRGEWKDGTRTGVEAPL